MKNSYDHAMLQVPLVLGIPVIDQQHANLLRITNNLHSVCLNSAKIEKFRLIRAIREAIDYIRQHFNTEEKLMQLSNYPGFLEHKKMHSDFIWEILSHFGQFEDDQKDTPQKFAQYFSDWVNLHIVDSDKEFAEFFLNVKQPSKLRMVLSGEPQLAYKIA